MTRNPPTPSTSLCRHTANEIFYRRRNLVGELLGNASFTDVLFYQILAREPNNAERQIVDAVLVALMEHGLTPSATAARLVYTGSPDNIQAGVAAGLLAVGSAFVGTTEDCAALLAALTRADDLATAARACVAGHVEKKKALPGFGHHLHRPDDPRAKMLLALAAKLETAAGHCRALDVLSGEVDRAIGRHLTINATGAVAAILADIGVPARAMRGFALISRAAGLVAHLVEEQERPTGRAIWALVDKEIPYRADAPSERD
ncbi:MAG: citryl-CoA lyase [Noviherbaspirillum sp.]